MTSFQLSVTPHRRAAARFVDKVHRCLQKAYADTPEVSQTDIANALGVHRSVINRQLRGRKDMTFGRAAEIAWALGYEPAFVLAKPQQADGQNHPPVAKPDLSYQAPVTASSATIPTKVVEYQPA